MTVFNTNVRACRVRQNSRRALTACVLMVTFVLAAGCTPGHHAARTPPTEPAPTQFSGPDTNASSVLDSAWASNTASGYFIEAPTVGEAMSLYDTVWWEETLTALGRHPDRLNQTKVQAWAEPLLTRTADTDGDVAGLPMMERVADTARLLHDVHVPNVAPAVVRALAPLRSGARFRSQTSAAPDWGDTVLALFTYTLFSEPWPTEDAKTIPAEIRRAVSDRNPKDLLAFTVPMLSLAPLIHDGPSRAELNGATGWALHQIAYLPALFRLPAISGLEPLLRYLQTPGWRGPQNCRGLSITPGGVAENTTSGPDPQLTKEAITAGCITHAAVPPWTTAGWPNSNTISGALPATVDGLRVAETTGITARYLPGIRTQLASVWAPGMRSNNSPPQLAAFCTLKHLLKQPCSPTITSRLPPTANPPTPADVPTLLLDWLTAAPPTPSATPTRNKSTPPKNVSIMALVAADLAARTHDDAAGHLVALHSLAQMKTPHGLFSITPGAAPSVIATLLAAWIQHAAAPIEALIHSGLCRTAYQCGTGTDGQPPLMIAAAEDALSRGEFPFAY